jgi:hypothetical protein
MNSNGSKYFQTVSNFGWLEKCFPELGKFEIKYGFEALDQGNNFLYRNFSIFEMELELKFREASVSWNQGIFDWKIFGT